MREIKFRAWIPEMYFPANPKAHYIYDWQDSTWFGMMRFDSDKLIYEQYTGLKDKNGKEIYEGDIIQVKTSSYGEYIAPVAYHTESAFFATDNHQAKQIKNPENWTLEHDKVDSYGFCMDRYSQLIGGYNNTYNHNSKSYDIEIIGNIHQNKELLNDSI